MANGGATSRANSGPLADEERVLGHQAGATAAGGDAELLARLAVVLVQRLAVASLDTIDHGWLVKFVEHPVAGQRVVRLIQKWLSAGVLEDGKHPQVEEGTPQGGSATPSYKVAKRPDRTNRG